MIVLFKLIFHSSWDAKYLLCSHQQNWNNITARPLIWKSFFRAEAKSSQGGTSDFLVIKSGISPQRSIQSKDVKLVMATVTKPASTSSVGIKKWRWILNSYICVFMAGMFLEMVSAMEPWNEIKSLSLKPVGNKRTNFVIMDWFTLLSADWSENILDLSALFCSFHYRHFIFLH